MKQIILFIVSMFMFILTIQAQEQIKYIYDASGNRIKKEIVLVKRSISEEIGSNILSEKIAERIIKIYPNPTKGKMAVEISDIEKAKSASLIIYNIQGKIVLSKDIKLSYTDLDISNVSKGIYVLHIKIDNETSSWKIIKE